MILGVGIDVVDIDRFSAQLRRVPRLRDRVFTATEQELPPASLAARFAAKEAVAKSLGVPRGLSWLDAWVEREESGRPLLRVRGSVAARAEQLGVTRFHLSLSHDAGVASAVVIAEGAAGIAEGD